MDETDGAHQSNLWLLFSTRFSHMTTGHTWLESRFSPCQPKFLTDLRSESGILSTWALLMSYVSIRVTDRRVKTKCASDTTWLLTTQLDQSPVYRRNSLSPFFRNHPASHTAGTGLVAGSVVVPHVVATGLRSKCSHVLHVAHFIPAAAAIIRGSATVVLLFRIREANGKPLTCECNANLAARILSYEKTNNILIERACRENCEETVKTVQIYFEQ